MDTESVSLPPRKRRTAITGIAPAPDLTPLKPPTSAQGIEVESPAVEPTPAPTPETPAAPQTAPTPPADSRASEAEEPKRMRITLSVETETNRRLLAGLVALGPKFGSRHLSPFAELVMELGMDELERRYNEGQKFEDVGDVMVPTGRPRKEDRDLATRALETERQRAASDPHRTE